VILHLHAILSCQDQFLLSTKGISTRPFKTDKIAKATDFRGNPPLQRTLYSVSQNSESRVLSLRRHGERAPHSTNPAWNRSISRARVVLPASCSLFDARVCLDNKLPSSPSSVREIRRKIANLTTAGVRDPPANHHPHRRVVAMSTLGRRRSRPSASPVSNGHPVRKSPPGR
jgi:hypothetical protein